MEFITLNNGVKMPAEGIGTFLLTPDEAETAVLSALKDGARLIDTANAYCNEKAVGRAMKKSGLLREEIFLETKLWPTFYTDADAVDKTLARLDTDYIDLLLIHQPAGDYVAGYRLMEKAYKEGKVRAIGLSNFNEEQIKEILSICEVKPTILQTEVHPYAQQKELKAFLAENGMVIQAWYPRWATLTRACWKSRCSPALQQSTARATCKLFCAGTFRQAMWSFPAPRTRPTSTTTSMCSILR